MRNYIIFLFIMIISGCGVSDSVTSNTIVNTTITDPTITDPTITDPTTTTSLNHKTLVIGLNFNNQQLVHSEDEILNRIFGTNIGEGNHYYKTTSQNKFSIERISETQGLNNGFINLNINTNIGYWDVLSSGEPQLVLNEALTSAMNYVDLTTIDVNHDNIITSSEMTVIFIVAGSELSYDSTEPIGVWGQSYYFVNTAKTYYYTSNGYTFTNRYGAFGEQHKSGTNTHLATIGIIVHELGHAIFDLFDLYPTSYDNSDIKIFGLMGSGNWNMSYINGIMEPGNTPSSFSAYSKIKNNWITPVEINKGQSLSNFQFFSNTQVDNNILKANVSTGEYFLIENISELEYGEGFKYFFPMYGGLNIFHVNENASSIVEVEYSITDFLGTSYVNSDKFLWHSNTIDTFDNTNPIFNSDLRDGTPSGLSISGISNQSEIMTANIQLN